MEEILAFIVSTWYIWIVAFGIFVYKFSIPKTKNYIGERIVSFNLSRLDRNKYKVINYLMLKIEDNFVRIDHIVISDYGIFVIETNNHRGWILGSEDSEYWTRVTRGRKEMFHNPIIGNANHIKILRQSLNNYNQIEYISLIVFTAKSDIKIKTDTNVIYFKDINKTIEKYDKITITDKDKEDIYIKLNALNVDSRQNRREHAKNLKNERRLMKRNKKLDKT